MLKTHNQEIEVLRAVAVLFVVIEHLPGLIFWESPFLNKVTSNFSFWSGVDLFFVISGFVISQSLIWQLTSTEDQNIITKIKSFWIRRIYRVIPSAWIWLFITLFLHTLFDAFKLPSNINNDNFKESLAILLEVR